MKRSFLAVVCFSMAACGQSGPSSNELAETRTDLDRAALAAMAGAPYDTSSMGERPGVEQILREQATRGREGVRQQLRDPSSADWGKTWTEDYVWICGTVNGANALGGRTGGLRYYALQGLAPAIEGNSAFDEAIWSEGCSAGAGLVLLPAD